MPEEKNVDQYSTFLVNLPSKGKLYSEDSPLRDGVIEMKYGTTKEEDILLNRSYINKGIVFNKLLESLIVTKNIKIDDLVIGDLNTLIIETKKSMYGPTSNMKVKCPVCNDEINFVFDINKLEVFEIPEDVEENSFEFTSSLKNKFTYHILTQGENENLKKTIIKKNKLTNNGSRNVTLSDGLVQIIDAINDDNNKSTIRDYIKNGKMSSIESRELRKDITKNTPDVDLAKRIECNNCSFYDYVDIPLDVNFFWNSGDDDRRYSRRNF